LYETYRIEIFIPSIKGFLLFFSAVVFFHLKWQAMRRLITADVFASILILLFGYTAFSKLLDLSHFKDVLWQAPIIGPGAGVVAWMLPLTELLIVLLLFFPAWRYWGFLCSLVLLVVFTVYLVYMLLFSANLPCQCGGVIGAMGWKTHVGFNVVFMGVAWWGMKKEAASCKLQAASREVSRGGR
jgi:hypothetical protein